MGKIPTLQFLELCHKKVVILKGLIKGYLSVNCFLPNVKFSTAIHTHIMLWFLLLLQH